MSSQFCDVWLCLSCWLNRISLPLRSTGEWLRKKGEIFVDHMILKWLGRKKMLKSFFFFSHRLSRYQQFKDFQRRILVATNLFGRGMDIERVNIVFNYDMPEDSDTYLHRVSMHAVVFCFFKPRSVITVQGWGWKNWHLKIVKLCYSHFF